MTFARTASVRRGAARIAEAYLGATGRQLETHIFPLAEHTFRLRQGGPGAWPMTVAGCPERLIEWVLRVSRP